MREIKIKKTRYEHFDIPYEGIFWIFDNRIIIYAEQVDISGRLSTTFNHVDIWNEIGFRYPIDNTIVPYHYYPRGRIMVNPIYENELFDHYDAYIYLDDCINNTKTIESLIYEFRLNKNCEIRYIGYDGGIESDHYKCHMCKGE
jgi:hypothetical protein